MAFENLYKDLGLGDVHVDGADALYAPAADDLYHHEVLSGRSATDIAGEDEADRRDGGYVQPTVIRPPNVAPPISKEFDCFFKVSGVNEELGLVFGWGIVCKDWDDARRQPVDYWDVQKNHIPEPAMVKATTRFMKNSRMAGHQHARMGAGTIVHSFPLTGEIWKAMFSRDGQMLGALPPEPPKSGWMVACAPDAEMLKDFKRPDGDPRKLTGFSIGGRHVHVDGKPV